MAFLVPLVPQEKKEKQDPLVSLAQMAYLELQEKGSVVYISGFILRV